MYTIILKEWETPFHIHENGVFYQDIEFSLLEEDNWIEDFIRNAPEDVREWLKVYVRSLDPEREELVDMLKCGMELENA